MSSEMIRSTLLTALLMGFRGICFLVSWRCDHHSFLSHTTLRSPTEIHTYENHPRKIEA